MFGIFTYDMVVQFHHLCMPVVHDFLSQIIGMKSSESCLSVLESSLHILEHRNTSHFTFFSKKNEIRLAFDTLCPHVFDDQLVLAVSHDMLKNFYEGITRTSMFILSIHTCSIITAAYIFYSQISWLHK